MDFENMKINNIEIVFRYIPQTMKFSVHNRSSHIIGTQMRGYAEHYFSDRCLSFCPGCLYFLNQTEDYDVDILEKGEAFSVHFTTSEPVTTKSFCLFPGSNAKIISLLDVMHRRFLSASDEHLLTSDFYRLCSIFCDILHKQYQPKDKRIAAAEEYIRLHFTEKNCLDDAAELCTLSRRRFNDIFKAALDTTPNQFLTNQRIELAKKLLKLPELSIGDVAEHSGFSDIYYFSLKFKCETGMTPSEYRNSV